MKKLLVTGKNGQVGWELQKTLAPLGHVLAVDSNQMDLSQPDVVRRVIRDLRPDWIVNPAAYTAVDQAETNEAQAMAVNGVAPGVIAEEAKRLGAVLVHFSTDYVFDGNNPKPYTELDEPRPLSVYGKTKLAGEHAVAAVGGTYIILRTSWVYAARGKNFPLTILRLAQERPELHVVNDQVGAPTWSRMLAELTAQIIAQCGSLERMQELNGVYHASAAGQTTWFEFARALLKLKKIQTLVSPISTAQYPTAAQRPKNSLLSNEKLQRVFGLALPLWNEQMELCFGA